MCIRDRSSNVSITGILASSYGGGYSRYYGRSGSSFRIGSSWGGGRHWRGGYYGGGYDDEDNWSGFADGGYYGSDESATELFKYGLYYGRMQEYQRDLEKYIKEKREKKEHVTNHRLSFLDKMLSFRNDFDARLKLYDHYIEDNGKNAGFWRYLGNFAYQNERYKLAREYFNKYTALRPVDPDSINDELHYIALKIGDDNMAEVYRKKILGGDTSEKFAPNYTIFDHLLSSGKYEKAKGMLPLLEKYHIRDFEKRPFWRKNEKLIPLDVALPRFTE